MEQQERRYVDGVLDAVRGVSGKKAGRESSPAFHCLSAAMLILQQGLSAREQSRFYAYLDIPTFLRRGGLTDNV